MSTPGFATTLLDEGANYRLMLEGDTVVATVFRREELSSAEGADCAERMTRSIEAALARADVRAFVLDLFAAPPIMGPRTLATIGHIVQRAVALRRTVRLVSGPTAMGRLQLERLARDHGAEGSVVAATSETRARAPR
jgi:hypothetical protein